MESDRRVKSLKKNATVVAYILETWVLVTCQVKEQVTERDLHRGLDPLLVGGHGRYECGRRGAEVGAERQRVHPLDGDEPDADEGRDG